jgi:hypothetical protein
MRMTPDEELAQDALAADIAEEIVRERDQRDLHRRFTVLERRLEALHTLVAELILRTEPPGDRRAALQRLAAQPGVAAAAGAVQFLSDPVATTVSPCDTAYPRCRSACCRINEVPLAADELDQHPWDECRPFLMKRREDGACIRLDPDGVCTVYERRPRHCRQYSCIKDERVWQMIDSQ